MTSLREHNDTARDTPVFDQPRAEAAVRELLLAIGEDPDRQGFSTLRPASPGPTRS